MKTIVIKTQSEIDALPNSFAEYTRIEIRSTERIYVKKAWGNSSVEACENSSVEAWENSSVVAFQFAVVFAFSYLTLRLFDWACVRSKYKGQKFEINGSNVVQINDFEAKDISFDTWLIVTGKQIGRAHV